MRDIAPRNITNNYVVTHEGQAQCSSSRIDATSERL